MTIDDQKFQKRATAYKLTIDDINSGDFISNDFGSYLKKYNLKITRVRIMATVIQKKIYEGGETMISLENSDDRGKHAFLVLDDGSGTIRLKAWKSNVEMIYPIQIGDIIDTVARVRKYQDEIYLVPDFIRKIDDPNWELMRELEIMNLKKIYLNMKPQNELQVEKIEKSTANNIEYDTKESIKDEDSLEFKILSLIESSGHEEGIPRKEIYDKFDISNYDIDESIKNLINNGKIFITPNNTIKKT